MKTSIYFDFRYGIYSTTNKAQRGSDKGY